MDQATSQSAERPECGCPYCCCPCCWGVSYLSWVCLYCFDSCRFECGCCSTRPVAGPGRMLPHTCLVTVEAQ